MKGTLTVHTDGGARGNPGPAACSFVIENDKEVLEKKSKYLGKTTNNVAEYEGVILALKWIDNNKDALKDFFQINFYLDSELIVRQILGVYKVRDEKLRGLYYQVYELINTVGKKVSFSNVPRAKNKIADFLVNEELDRSR